jgi:hypothetical protein
MQEVADASGCASISRTEPRIAGMTDAQPCRRSPRVFNILFLASISQTLVNENRGKQKCCRAYKSDNDNFQMGCTIRGGNSSSSWLIPLR